MLDEDTKPDSQTPVTPDEDADKEIDAIVVEGDDDKKKLQTALHKERKARREAEKKASTPDEVTQRVAAVESELKKEREMRPFLASLGSEQMASDAYAYFQKLSEGVGDSKALDELRRKAIRLVAEDASSPIPSTQRVQSGMHSSSNPSYSSGEVTPQTAEMARQFGVDPEKLKESGRRIKGLYNN